MKAEGLPRQGTDSGEVQRSETGQSLDRIPDFIRLEQTAAYRLFGRFAIKLQEECMRRFTDLNQEARRRRLREAFAGSSQGEISVRPGELSREELEKNFNQAVDEMHVKHGQHRADETAGARQRNAIGRREYPLPGEEWAA